MTKSQLDHVVEISMKIHMLEQVVERMESFLAELSPISRVIVDRGCAGGSVQADLDTDVDRKRAEDIVRSSLGAKKSELLDLRKTLESVVKSIP